MKMLMRGIFIYDHDIFNEWKKMLEYRWSPLAFGKQNLLVALQKCTAYELVMNEMYKRREDRKKRIVVNGHLRVWNLDNNDVWLKSWYDFQFKIRRTYLMCIGFFYLFFLFLYKAAAYWFNAFCIGPLDNECAINIHHHRSHRNANTHCTPNRLYSICVVVS